MNPNDMSSVETFQPHKDTAQHAFAIILHTCFFVSKSFCEQYQSISVSCASTPASHLGNMLFGSFYQSKLFPYHGCFGWDWKGYSCQTTRMNQAYCHQSWLLHFEANPPSRLFWLVSVLFSYLVPRLLKTLRNTFMLQHPAARSARPRLLQAKIDKEME